MRQVSHIALVIFEVVLVEVVEEEGTVLEVVILVASPNECG